MEDATSSRATMGIALELIGIHLPLYFKVETQQRVYFM